MKYTFLILLTALLAATQAKSQNELFEAEDANLYGVNVVRSLNGYSGDGYVSGFDNEGDKVEFVFDWEQSGSFQLYINYAATSGNKNNYVIVNGDNLGDLLFPASNSFKELDAGKIFLVEGENTISIEKSWGWFEVDYIRIASSIPSADWNISTEPVNPNASAEVISLKKFLVHNFGKTTFAGQFTNESSYYKSGLSDINYVYELTGKYPAVYGNDLIDYTPSRVEYGTSSRAVEDLISWSNDIGGMVTLTWHWNAPTDLYNTDENPWWSGFYTRATSFNIKDVLANPEGEKYALVLRDIDAIAVQLKKIEEANIPVLWRPLHEAEGTWFWWGSQGPEACKSLWYLLYDRLTNYHNINNLLWVWTTTDSPSSLDWYPGDAYVDILGVDVYLEDGDYSVSSTLFDNLRNLYDGRKLLTMSENGTIPDADKMLAHDAYWSYFCTWEGDFIRGGKKNSNDHIVKTFQHTNITTADELPENWDQFVHVDEENFYDSSVKVYPNPVSNRLHINCSEQPQAIHVFDSSGKQMYLNENIEGLQLDIVTDSLPVGIYKIKIDFKHGYTTKKIVKIDR